MKILIVVEYFYPHIGGVERVFLEIGKRLIKRGNKVVVFTTSETQPFLPSLKCNKKRLGGLIKYYKYQGITITRLSLPTQFKRYIFAFFSLPFMFFLFPDVDIVHSANNYTVALPTFLFARLTRKPITITVWEIWGKLWLSFYPQFLGIFFLFYEKLILCLPFDLFFTPSRFVYNQLNTENSYKKAVAPLSGKSLEFNKSKRAHLRSHYNIQNNFVFLYYGRWGKNKGVDILIKAYAKIVDQFPDSRLFLFIPQPTLDIGSRIFSLISSYNLQDFARLFPGIPESDYSTLASTLSFADCVVIPDVAAAFGMSALEASEAQRPIVTTKAGGLPEVAYGKVIFAKPGSVRSLAQSLVKACKGRWKTIPQKNFSWDKTASIYQNQFKNLLSKNPN